MTPKHFYNVLESHPHIIKLQIDGRVIHFDYVFEIYTAGGGGQYEIAIEAWYLPTGYMLYNCGHCGTWKDVTECQDHEKVELSGNFSPETICDALTLLAKRSHGVGDDNDIVILTGD